MLRSRYTYDMLWVGTQRGVAVHDPSPDADPAWRYLRGPRWQPPGDGSVTAMAQAHFSAARFSSHVCVATSGGVTWYQAHPTTLSQKAAAMERTLVRHDRHGLVAESALGSFGNLSSVTQHDSGGAVSSRRHWRELRCRRLRALPRWDAAAARDHGCPGPVRALCVRTVRTCGAVRAHALLGSPR
jgi:hypothetical protein